MKESLPYRRLVAVFIAAICCANALAGESVGEPDADAVVKEVLSRKVAFKFDFDDSAFLDDFCDAIAKLTSLNVIVDAGIDPYQRLKSMPIDGAAAEVVRSALQKMDLDFQIIGGCMLIIKKDQPRKLDLVLNDVPKGWGDDLRRRLQLRIDFDHTDTWPSSVVGAIGIATKTNLLLQGGVRNGHKPLFHVKGMPAETLLMWVIALYKLQYRFRDEALFIFDERLRDKQEPSEPSEADKKTFTAAMTALSADGIAAREQATNTILKLGECAMPLLDEAVSTLKDLELSGRLEKILTQLSDRELWFESPATRRILAHEEFDKSVELEVRERHVTEVMQYLWDHENMKIVRGDDEGVPLVTVCVYGMKRRNVVRWIARLGNYKLSSTAEGDQLQIMRFRKKEP